MQRMCVSIAVSLIEVQRGTPKFTEISQELYGSLRTPCGRPHSKRLGDACHEYHVVIKDKVDT